MRRFSILAAMAAMALWCGTLSAGERIKLPTAASHAKVTAAVQHGTTPITTVAFGRRAYRRGFNNGYYSGGYYGGGYYSPGYSYSYRPSYGYNYGYPYGSYYSQPYYGYSYGPGAYGGWGTGMGMGLGPMAAGGWGGMWW